MDRVEIDALYRKYGPMIFRRARALLGEEQAAKDAMQEVFLRALRAGSEFRDEASPVTWLYQVTTNYCLNVIRDSSRRSDLRAERPPPVEASPAASPESQIMIANVLRNIPEQLRNIAIYYFIDEMNQEEIAALLGVSRRTIGNRLEEFRQVTQAMFGHLKNEASSK